MMLRSVCLLVALCFNIITKAQECSELTPPFVSIPQPWLPSSIAVATLPKQNVHSYLMPDSVCHDPDDVVTLKPVVIGELPQFDSESAVAVVHAAKAAWKKGIWTNEFTLQDRIQAIRNFLNELKTMRDELSHILQWEIAKNVDDANAEVDRTIAFCEHAIMIAETELSGEWSTVSKYHAFIKRAALGIVMALAPYNYPLNECYATILPALLMGNVIVLKIPSIGGLVHLKTFEAFAKHLPEGTIHFVSGSGRATMPPIMKTGLVDALAFIGGSKAADDLIRSSPHPHRLKSFLQLEAKNLGIIFPDARWNEYETHKDVLEAHIDNLVTGSLSYNGQRCTAIKLIFIPEDLSEMIVPKLVEKVQQLAVGLPWQQTSGKYSKITPLPNPGRIKYMKELLQDATDQGATLYSGGEILGGPESTLMTPAVVGPIQPGMRLYNEEQFGPIVAIATYQSIDDVFEYVDSSDHAQQVALFGYDTVLLQRCIDAWGAVYGKISINAAPGRSPDTVPFSGRRSSALGVMSVRDALLEFSIPTVVSGPREDKELLEGLAASTKFLQTF